MRVCMVLDQEFPTDIRVEKECGTLVGEKHEIHLVARNKNRRATEDEVEGVFVHRLRCLPQKLGKLNNWISIPHFLNPVWFFKLLSVVSRHRIEAIHVHNLPLAPLGLVVGKLRRIPVILDNHENYPAVRRAVGYPGLVLHILYNPLLLRFVEMICVKYVTHIICAGEGHERLLIQKGIPPRKLTTLINAVDLGKFSRAEISQNLLSEYQKCFVLVYLGGFPKTRCLELAIRAIPLLKDRIPDLRLLLFGGEKTPKQLKMLRSLCKQVQVEEYVVLKDWVDFAYVPTYIFLSAICLLPLVPGEHINTTTSHKLFQYMAMGKPVIITNVELMGSIVERENCGIVVSWDSPEEMADAVLRLYTQPEYARRLGANGRRAVEERYNWGRISKRLVHLYRMMGDL